MYDEKKVLLGMQPGELQQVVTELGMPKFTLHRLPSGSTSSMLVALLI